MQQAKRIAGLVTATTLLWGHAAFAQVEVNAQAVASAKAEQGVKALAAPRTSFPDVPADHWAVKHIAKLALKGISQGDDQGQYKPDQALSRQDALIMLVRMMGLEAEAKSRTAEVYMPLEVRDDAKDYVVMALDKKWIELATESVIVHAEPGKAWGAQPATREWLSRVVIRALGKTNGAVLTDGADIFADRSSINATYLGYVSEAVKLGIVGGFEDSTFRPQGNVTRAQMATFLGRSEKYVTFEHPSIRSGVFAGWKDALTMRIYDDEGNLQEWRLGAEPQLYDEQANSQRISASDLKPGHPVYLLVADNTAYYVERLSAEQQTKRTEGKLLELDLDKMVVKLSTPDGQQLSVELDPNIIAVNVDGAGMDVALLPKGTLIVLEQVVGVPGAKPSRLVVQQLPLNKDFSGTVESVDLTNRSLSVRTASGIETFPWTADTKVTAKGQAIPFERLGTGDTIEVEVRDSVVETVDVLKQLVEIVEQGKAARHKDDKLLTVERADGTYGTYAISDKVQTYYNGLLLRFADLLDGDQIRMEISDNKIDRIFIEKRNVNVLRQVAISRYDVTEKWLTVKRDDGKPETFVLNDSTTLQFNGQLIPLAQFSTIFTAGKRIDLTFSGSDVLQLKMSTSYDGTLYRYNAQTREVTIQDGTDGEYVTFKLADYPIVRLAGKTSATPADLQIGDSIRVQLNGNQDRVDSIAVRSEQVFHVASLQKSTYVGGSATLGVVEAGGTKTSSYSLGSSVSIEQTGRTGLTVDSILTREPVALKFLGDTLEAVVLLAPVRGEVTAVDTAAGTVKIRTGAGNEAVVKVTGTTARIYRSGSQQTSLAQLAVGDRVEASLDSKGNGHFIVYAAESRTVASYDRNTGVLKLNRKSTSDTQTDFVFLPGARIHKSGESYHPNFLLKDQSVKVYVWRDEILELERV